MTPVIPEEVIHRVEVNLFYYSCFRPYHLYSINKSFKDQNISDSLSLEKSNSELYLTSRTCMYLLENLSKQQSLDSISKHMGTNRSKLAASFKSSLGISIFQWLREQRLNKANILICKTTDSIRSIALDVGYSNFPHFSTAYKAYFGTSPSRQRKRYAFEKNNY